MFSFCGPTVENFKEASATTIAYFSSVCRNTSNNSCFINCIYCLLYPICNLALCLASERLWTKPQTEENNTYILSKMHPRN